MSFPFMAALSWRATATQYVSTKTFRIGAEGMTEDGSLYRLCKSGAAITNPVAAAINRYRWLSGVTGDGAEAALAAAIAVGDVDFTFNDTNSRAADYYKDGYYVDPRSSSAGPTTMHIWKSNAGAGTSVKCYVSAPFTQTNASGNTVQAYPNPWGNVRAAGAYSQGYEHFCCMPGMPITSGYYFWGKVKGPFWCWVTGTWPGAAQNDRDCCFWIDGTIKMQDEGINTSAISLQRAGYLMFSGNYGDSFLMIQIE